MKTPICEITIEELCQDYDWEEVFGEGGGGNCTPDVDSLDGTPTNPVGRVLVKRIIAAVNGENDEDEWVGVFELHDGRFLAAHGSCDYTGWDCRAGNTLTVAASLDTVVRMGLTADQAARLGLPHPAHAS